MNRRRVLFGVGSMGSLAGCIGGSDRLSGDDQSDQVFGVGEIEVVIDSEPVDLSADRFQAEHADDYAIEFHLHEFDDQWYMEGDRRVQVAEALDMLPEFAFRVEDEGGVLTIDDETYDARDPDVSITIQVNDETVDPEAYILDDGDDISVEVTTT